MERAKADEEVPAVVIGAKGTGLFYKNCGFMHIVGYVSTAEGEGDEGCTRVKRIYKTNLLKTREICGGADLWAKLRKEA